MSDISYSISEPSTIPKRADVHHVRPFAPLKVTCNKAQAKTWYPIGTLANPGFDSDASERKAPNKKRSRKSKFSIFVDSDAAESKTLKKPRYSSRKPLSVRMDSANSTPTPSPRLPTTPFSIPHEDPFWLDKENYDTYALPTPPSTPRSFRTIVSPTVNNSTPLQDLPRPRPTRVMRQRHTSTRPPLPLPSNMVLYNLLDLNDWNAGVEEIVGAYRAIVMHMHPDKVPEEEREYATEQMQMLNGAKEVLLDAEQRRQYHLDGVLPWAA